MRNGICGLCGKSERVAYSSGNGCDISAVDKALVFGILLELPKLDESDIQ